MKRILFLLCFITLSACANKQVSEQSTKQIPQERIYDSSLITSDTSRINDNISTITFFRDSHYVGSGCSITVSVNDKKIFAIRSGEYITLNLQPADYFILLETGAGLCPNVLSSHSTNLISGGHEKYKVSLYTGQLEIIRVE